MPGCASYSIPDGPSERTLSGLGFPLGLAAPRFTVNLARFTKTRDCISCFGSTISGMRLFTKSRICIALALHPGTLHFYLRTAFLFFVLVFPPPSPFIFITSVRLVFRAGRPKHVFGLHPLMRLANGFDARHCIYLDSFTHSFDAPRQ